jgi:hypothetical protein
MISPEDRKTIIKWCIQAVVGVAGYAAIIFLAAGRLDWLWGWVFIGLTGIFMASHVVLLVPINPDLLVERAGGLRQEGGKRWDRWIAFLAGGVFPIASWIVAALDLRFTWSIPKPLAVHLIGMGGVVLGYSLFMWAMVSNAFFSEVVRIQEDRGHTVATSRILWCNPWVLRRFIASGFMVGADPGWFWRGRLHLKDCSGG